jgi:excisionase family DNA binding protein
MNQVGSSTISPKRDRFTVNHSLLPPSKRRVLRLSSVAILVGVSVRTIRYWIELEHLPAHRRGPKLWFVYADDLENFLSCRIGNLGMVSSETDTYSATPELPEQRK